MNQFLQRKLAFLGAILFVVTLVTGSILYATKTSSHNTNKIENTIGVKGKEETPSAVSTYRSKTVTPTMKPSFVIKNQDDTITDLITTYYNAVLSADKKTYDKITVDDDSIEIDVLLRKMEYIVGYDNQEIYVTQGTGSFDLVAYIVYDLKINSIKTPAPSIDQLLIKHVDGYPKLYFNELTLNEAKQIEAIRNHEEVITLIQKVNNSFETAIQSDSHLYDFYKTLAKRTADGK
jgi:hypothetical protein